MTSPPAFPPSPLAGSSSSALPSPLPSDSPSPPFRPPRGGCRYERHRSASSRWAVLRPLGHAEFPGVPASVPAARRWARDLLSGRVADSALDDTLLLLSEIVTNAIVHSDSGRGSYGSVTVCVALSDDHGGGMVHVEVIDDGADGSLPFVRAATADGDGGRGLFMVESMSARWGVHHDGEVGSAVWFHLPDGRRPV